MDSIKIMEFIPDLSEELANWCLQGVKYIVSSDNVVHESERLLMESLSKRLGAEPVADKDNSFPGPPPDMTEDQRQFLLRTFFVAAWIDGDFCEEEKKAIDELSILIEEDNSLVELASLEARKAILIAAVIENTPKLINSSEFGQRIIENLKLSAKDVDDAVNEWRRRL